MAAVAGGWEVQAVKVTTPVTASIAGAVFTIGTHKNLFFKVTKHAGTVKLRHSCGFLFKFFNC
jgi:hypothetical protein